MKKAPAMGLFVLHMKTMHTDPLILYPPLRVIIMFVVTPAGMYSLLPQTELE